MLGSSVYQKDGRVTPSLEGLPGAWGGKSALSPDRSNHCLPGLEQVGQELAFSWVQLDILGSP